MTKTHARTHAYHLNSPAPVSSAHVAALPEVAEILERQGRIHAQEMYGKFTDEYPDFAPKAKMTVSRIRFYKWLAAYGTFKYGKPPEEGKDASGRWFRFINDDPPF